MLISETCLFAQNKLPTEKRNYKSKSGKLFVQKELPVYLKISTSLNDTAKKYLLSSKSMTQYTNPMYFDANGFNSIRTLGEVNSKTKEIVQPLKDVIFEVYGDNKPPQSYHIYHKKVDTYTKGKRVYYNQVKFALLSYDAFSGVDKIYYSVNNTAYKVVPEEIIIDTPGDYTVKFYATDNVGNIEEGKSISFIITENK